jgi:hypothetical protein
VVNRFSKGLQPHDIELADDMFEDEFLDVEDLEEEEIEVNANWQDQVAKPEETVASVTFI